MAFQMPSATGKSKEESGDEKNSTGQSDKKSAALRRSATMSPSRRNSGKSKGGDPLRWTPGTPTSPNRHTFSADVYRRRRRLGSAISQDPSLIRKIRNDLRQEMTKPGIVTAKKKALQDMAVTRLANVCQRYLHRIKLKGMFTWKYGAVKHLRERTTELEEALDSSNDLNDHLESNLRELENKLDKIITTESLTRRKSQKAMNVASSRSNDLKKALASLQDQLKRANVAHALSTARISSAGAQALVKAMWRALTRDALLLWKNYHRRLGAHLDKTDMALNWHARRRLRACFQAFRVAVHQHNRSEDLYRRKLRITKRDVLNSWHAYIDNRRRAAYLLGKLCGVARRSDMRPAFQRLTRVDVVLKAEQMVEENEKQTSAELSEMRRNMMEKVVLSMSRVMSQNHRANLSNSLRRWHHACQQTHLAVKYHRKAAWLVHARAMTKVWNQWKCFLARRKRARRTVSTIVRRFAGDDRQWCLDCGWNAFARNASWISGRERAAKLVVAFVARQALGKQQLALTAWSRRTRTIASRSRAQRGAERLMARLLRNQTAKYFSAWFHAAQGVLLMRRKLLARILERKRRISLHLGVAQWQRNGARNIIGGMAIRATHRVARQTKWRLTRTGFAKWLMVMRRDRALKNRLRTRKRLQNLRVLHICWEAWDVERSQGKEQDRLARCAAKKITLELRKRVFTEWKAEAVRCVHERVLLRRAAGKIRNRQMQMCFHTWLDFVDGRQHARALAKRVFRRLLAAKVRTPTPYSPLQTPLQSISSHPQKKFVCPFSSISLIIQQRPHIPNTHKNTQVTSAWNKWFKDTYEAARAFEAKRAELTWTCFEKKSRRLQRDAFRSWLTDMREYIVLTLLLAKGSKRIHRMRLLTTFRTWRSNATENKRQRVILLRAAARIRNRSINKCLGSWRDLVARRDGGREMLGRMLAVFVRNRKRVTIMRWRQWLQIAHQAEARQSNYTAQLSRTMAKWRNRNKAAAFRTWNDRIDEAKRNRRLVARAAARWVMRSAAKCLSAWVMYADRRIHNRHIVAKFAAKWLKRLEFRSFGSWITFVERRRQARNNMRRALLRFKEKRSTECFLAWKSVPICVKRQRVVLIRIVRRWRGNHLRRKWAQWRLFTTTDRILARKKKSGMPPPPVVEEELSTESAMLRRTLERGFVLPASNGIPKYNPIRDRHATYAHTEQFRKEMARLRMLEAVDRKSARVRFPGQGPKKMLEKQRKQSLANRMTRQRTRGAIERPSSAPRRRRRGGGIGGRDAALEVRRSSSLREVGHGKKTAWGNGSQQEEDNGGGTSAADGSAVGREQLEAALLSAAEAKKEARMYARKVKEAELSMQVAKQQNLTRQKQLQAVIESTDERVSEITFERDNLAVEVATKKRRAKSMQADAERRLEREIDRREELERKLHLIKAHLEHEERAHLKKVSRIREEALQEAATREKEKRKNLVPQSALRKLEKEKRNEVNKLTRIIENQKKREESLEDQVVREKQRGEDAVHIALEDAKATLEAQQAIVRAAEDRNLRSHLQVQKEKKRCRDGLVKADEKAANMEAEMVEMRKKLVSAKRLLRKEKKKNSAHV